MSHIRISLSALQLALVFTPFAFAHAQYAPRIVVRNDQEIPESGGLRFQNTAFGRVAISNTGRILFMAHASGSGGLPIFRYVVEETGNLRMFAPGVPDVEGLEPGVDFIHDSSTHAHLDAGGRVALTAMLQGNGVVTEAVVGGPPRNDRAIAVEDGAALVLLFREGAFARENYGGSDTHVAPERPTDQAVVNGARMAFSDRLTIYTEAFVSPWGGVQVLIGELEREPREVYFWLSQDVDPALPGLPDFNREILPAGTWGRRVALNRAGHVAFALRGERRSPTQRVSAVYRDVGTGPELLWYGEESLSGLAPVIGGLNSGIQLNAVGAVAFQRGSDEVWHCAAGGACRKALEVGAEAPGAGAPFSAFVALSLTDDDRLVVTASLSDGRRGIWMEESGAWRKVVLQGEPAPGTAEGALFGSIGGVAANNAGEVAFSAALVNTTQTPYPNADGVWVADGEEIVLVGRRGDPFDVGDGRTLRIESINIPESPFSVGGSAWGMISGPVTARTSHFNDLGELLFEVRLQGATPQDTEFALVHASRALIVNATGDGPDQDPGDGACDTGGPVVNGRPECTLRAAIMEANAREGRDRITYDVPGGPPYVIRPTSALPAITDPVSIVGIRMEDILGKAGQEGVAAVVLDGSIAGAQANGLVFEDGSQGSSVEDHVIVHFRQSGVVIAADGVIVRGSLIGLNGDLTRAPNHENGIHVQNAANAVIGGDRFRDGNTVAYNRVGIRITGQRSEGNRIQGNFVIEHDAEGIFVRDAPNNLIGGSEEALGNLISGNKSDGVLIVGGDATGNRLEGNFIGTDETGAAAWANRAYGIHVQNAPGNRIGGPRPARDMLGPGNVISGNDRGGILIEGGGATENVVQGNVIGLDPHETNSVRKDFPATFEAGDEARTGIHVRFAGDNQIGGATSLEGNSIGGDVYGVAITGGSAERNRVMGNQIIGAGAQFVGIYLGDSASGNEIGGPTDGPGKPPGNEIEFHRHSNVFVGPDSRANVVKGNRITGHFVVESNDDRYYPRWGMYVQGSENVVGGDEVRSRNVIYGSREANVRIEGDANRIQGNHVGVDEFGRFVSESARDQNYAGIVISGAARNVIGGETGQPGMPPGNVVAGHWWVGIQVDGDRTVVAGNLVGPAVDGALFQGGVFEGGTFSGIVVNGAENRIGGGPGLGNVVSANHNGIVLHGAGSVRNTVAGNRVGTGVTGQENWGNQAAGILISGKAAHNHVGGAIFSGNVIANNIAGIRLDNSIRNNITENTITDNRTGIGARTAHFDFIGNNRILRNDVGIRSDDSNLVIGSNDVKDGKAPESGIHVSGGSARIFGNRITDDAGDAIVVEDGAEAFVERNNVYGNAGFGLLSRNGSGTIPARNNWWGDASGPGGSGPGSGERVSAGIDFSDWRTTMVGLVASVVTDSLFIDAGNVDSTLVLVRNWRYPGESVDMFLSDEQGWLAAPGSLTVDLDENDGGSVPLTVTVPPGAPAGSASRVTLEAASRTDPADHVTETFVVVAYEAALHRIAVLPDSVTLLPGQSQRFTAAGFDQQNRSMTLVPIWSATGGTVTDEGVFTAGDVYGTFSVTAADPSGQIAGFAVVNVAASVSVESDVDVPHAFVLHQNYPNPFNPSTVIPFDVREHVHVVLKVYDVLGREVVTLVDRPYGPGRHQLVFDASGLPAGLYLYAIRMDGFRAVGKMVLAK